MNQEIRVAKERHFLGETTEERTKKFYHILKVMNECGEIEFLHALSMVCTERYLNESHAPDQSKKRKWFSMGKLSTGLKDKLLKQGADEQFHFDLCSAKYFKLGG